MANIDSDLIPKKLTHRGLYSGKEQSLSGRVRFAAGASAALADTLRMVPLGEGVRPMRITVIAKSVSGTPVLTNPSFSVGIAPQSATNHTRPDGTVYTPVTASATRLGASTALTTDEMAQFTEIDTVADFGTKWAPFYVTLTPSGAGAFSVAGGVCDIICEVVFLGEQQDADPIYTSFNSTKYKN